MAEIFKAEHLQLGQIRGLKVLLSEIAAQPDQLSRLLTEARTMARLRHPAIAEVHDFDVQGDSAFVVMECLPGITLRTWCDHVGKLARNPGLAAAIVGTLADGLAFAHQHGVVHRDLNPENVLLIPAPDDGPGFCLKIVDFGLAKMVREQPPASTRAGPITGAPSYLAPEQWRLERSIDHRADVYALGCVLFELLCGQPPFRESDARGMKRAHLADPPPDLTELEPEIPFRFQTLVARMLAKSAKDRHPSMEDVLTELEAISGRRRSQWSAMLRTPREGTMVARGTLVINLELKTIVDRPDIPESPSPSGQRLWQQLSKLEGLSRLLPTVRRLWQRLSKLEVPSRLRKNLARLPAQLAKVSGLVRSKLDSLPRLRPSLARLRGLRPAALWTFLKQAMVSPSRPAFAVIVCAGVMVTATLVWATRALLTSDGDVRPGAVVPATPPAGAPGTVPPSAPTAEPPRKSAPSASKRPPPPGDTSTPRSNRVRRAASRVKNPTRQLSPRGRRKQAPSDPAHVYRAVAD